MKLVNKSELPKILVVDDKPNNLLVYERVLSPLNLDVVKAFSGYEALEIAYQQDFFLILLDVQMPVMDGFETAELILDHPKTKNIPIIFITAIAKESVFKFKGYTSGAVDYLTKPINDSILLSKVSVFLRLWQQQSAISKQNKELQKINIELSHTAKQLQASKEKAEQATQAKTDFLSMMTHELRTPLNSVIVISELLFRKSVDQISQTDIESIGIINRSGNDLLLLINDILDLAKVEAGKVTIEITECNLRSFLSQLKTQMQPLSSEKDLSLELIIDEEVPEKIDTDELRFGQIIRNLISNAIKFTCVGGVKIMTKVHDDNTLSISIKDTGIGIKSENIKNIFEAFEQEDSSISRRFGGTGLGLSISLNLIKLLGGDISIKSDLGDGSCFTILIPISNKKFRPASDASN